MQFNTEIKYLDTEQVKYLIKVLDSIELKQLEVKLRISGNINYLLIGELR